MFRGFSGFFNKSNKDLRKKIYFTMMCLGIFCLGTTITIPWASAVYEELGFLEIFNVMSGGGLSNFSIFASIVTTIPATIVTLIGKQSAIDFVNKYIMYTSTTGFILYLVLIVVFAYFYTFLVMNPDEMSKNLNENGGYIPGIRPGSDTSKYISNSLSKLTLVGALFLVILAGMPILLSKLTSLPSYVTIGGTGILIVVGVAIETYKQLESSLVSRSYSSKRKRLR